MAKTMQRPLPPPAPPPLPPPPDPIPPDDLESVGDPITRASLKLPPIPGEYLSWEQWDAWQKTLTKDHWTHLDVYVYRLDPIIDREPKNIDCFGEYKDMNYFISTHGGGTYSLAATDRALPQRQQKICTVKFTVDKMKFDPILNYAELDLGDKRNRAYITKLQNKGILTQSMEVTAMQPRGADQSELVDKLTDKVIEMASDKSARNNAPKDMGLENQAASAAIKMVSDVSQKLMEQHILQANPLAQMEAMAKLLGLGQTKDGDKTLDFLKMMMETQSRTTQLMLDMNKAANERMERLIEKMDTRAQNGGGGSDMDKLDTFLTIAERLGGGGSQSTLQSIITAAKEVIPHFAGPVMSMIMGSKGYPVSPQQSPLPLSPDLIAANPQDQIPSPQGTTPMASPQSLSPQQIAQFISEFGPRILQAMERGDTGAELAQSLEMLMGYDTYLRIKAVVQDKALLMEGVALVPQFHLLIKGHGIEKFDEFIDSFVSWSQVRDSPDEP